MKRDIKSRLSYYGYIVAVMTCDNNGNDRTIREVLIYELDFEGLNRK